MLTIYGKQDCIYCERAVDTAKNYNIEFIYKSLEEAENLEELKDRLPKGLTKVTVPQIWSFSHYVGGYVDMINDIDNITDLKYDTFKL